MTSERAAEGRYRYVHAEGGLVRCNPASRMQPHIAVEYAMQMLAAASEASDQGPWSLDDDREHVLLDVIRSERQRWYDLRLYASERGDTDLSAAMDAASARYGERARTGEFGLDAFGSADDLTSGDLGPGSAT